MSCLSCFGVWMYAMLRPSFLISKDRGEAARMMLSACGSIFGQSIASGLLPSGGEGRRSWTISSTQGLPVRDCLRSGLLQCVTVCVWLVLHSIVYHGAINGNTIHNGAFFSSRFLTILWDASSWKGLECFRMSVVQPHLLKLSRIRNRRIARRIHCSVNRRIKLTRS